MYKAKVTNFWVCLFHPLEHMPLASPISGMLCSVVKTEKLMDTFPQSTTEPTHQANQVTSQIITPDTTSTETTSQISRDEFEARLKRHSNEIVLLLPLSSGRFATYTRDSQFHSILASADADTLRLLGQEFSSIMFQRSKVAEAARFYGEPDDRQWISDRRRERSSKAKSISPDEKPRRPGRKPKGQIVEITI